MTNSDANEIKQRIDLVINLKYERLDLANLNITDVDYRISELTHLKYLDISGNTISVIPAWITKLRNLETLIASKNKINNSAEFLFRLSELKYLDISGNNIQSLPHDFDDCDIVYLNVSKNPLGKLPVKIRNLTSLETLIAAEIGLTEFPDSILGMANLRTLNIKRNKISSLPARFVDFQKLRDFYITEDHMRSPPLEIINRGVGSIINYLHAFANRGESVTLREAKLIFIGEGEVGKTSLLSRMTKDQFISGSPTTKGIDIKKWEIEDLSGNKINLNIWDFGGQEIYHSTHQFFLTKRSIYLLLWDSRKDENILTFDYWLNVTSLLGDRSPIIIVQNKIDERIKRIDQESLELKFKNIQCFCDVSAKTGKNVDLLKNEIVNVASRLEHMGDVLPKAWDSIRNILISMELEFISREKYLEICDQFNINEEESGYLSQYFHDLGYFLHFQEDIMLNDIIFLDAEWATTAVYRIIDTPEVQENRGRFNYRELKLIWAMYPKDKHKYLLKLMEKFELCFSISDETYVVPELLDHKIPHLNWNYSNSKTIKYVYKFMPAGIMTRLIVRLRDNIVGQLFWKNGVVVSRYGTRAMIVSKGIERTIDIHLEGDGPFDILSIIQRDLEEIHKTLSEPEHSVKVPCSCWACRRSEEKYLHDYELLRRAKSLGKRKVECKNSLEDVFIDDVLGGINVGRDRRNESDSNNGSSTISSHGLSLNNRYDQGHFGRIGVSSEDFYEIIRRLDQLKIEEIGQLYKETKKGKISKIEKFGLPVVQGVSSSGFVEILKYIFI